MATTDPNDAPGYENGTIRILTPEEHAQEVMKRNAEELVEEDDDLSDLDEIDELADDHL